MLINAQEFYDHLKIAMNALGVRWGDMDQIVIEFGTDYVRFSHGNRSMSITVGEVS